MDLVEELARAIWADRYPDAPWDAASDMARENYRGHTRAALERLEQLGMVVVPREPTEEMLAAEVCADNFYNLSDGSPIEGGTVLRRGHELWRAMIEAAK